MKIFRLPLSALPPLGALLLTTSCVTAPAALANRGAYDDILTRAAQAGGAGLLTSGCAYRDEVGDDAILLETSALLADGVGRDATRYLTEQGMAPQPLATAVVVPPCAGFAFPPGETVLVKTNADDPAPRGMGPSALYPPGQPTDAPGVREALDRLYVQAFRDTQDPAAVRQSPAAMTMPLDLTAQERSTLRAATGHDWLWLVTLVTMQQSFVKGMGAGLAAQGGLLGAAVDAATRVDVAAGSHAALVNLNTGTRVWWGYAMLAPSIKPGLTLSLRPADHDDLATWGDTLFAPILHTGVRPRVVYGTQIPGTPTTIPGSPAS